MRGAHDDDLMLAPACLHSVPMSNVRCRLVEKVCDYFSGAFAL
jgi:hypothetical protein